ncbi:hypothetical protein LENED_004234 [Lentinula edodes]|uniref:F-box domain-containing protein n=1 Tax=Lentinula edodes TaxID=5353 RepID=A0A1Q3E5X7_LENED|nr:hypothetical protein LENED_004234 [Lentinula edodes]
MRNEPSATSIPPELKSYIATFCTPATLANLALVHKSFQEESEAILYKQLDVYIKKTQSTSIWSTLKLHPDKALLVRSLAIWFRPPWDSHNDDVPIAYTELFCCALANMHGLVDLRLHLNHRDVEWQVRITAVLSKKHFNLHSLHCSQFFDLWAITDAQSDSLQILDIFDTQFLQQLVEEMIGLFPNIIDLEFLFQDMPPESNMKQLSPIISLIPRLHELTFGHWFSPTTPYRGQSITNSDRFSLAKTLERVCPEFVRVLKKGRNFTNMKVELVQGDQSFDRIPPK